MSKRRDVFNLGQSFVNLIGSVYENINGTICEKLPDEKYKWNGFEGTREEVSEKIREAGKDLQNSIKK